MARKLVKNIFWSFQPPPKKNRVPKKIIVKNDKKSLLVKIAWNGEKIGQELFFLGFSPPPHPPKKKFKEISQEISRMN